MNVRLAGSCAVVTCCSLMSVLAPCAAEAVKPILTLEDTGGGGLFSPDGKQFAAKVAGKTWRATDVRIWGLATAEEVSTLKGHTGGIWRMSFSPDGKRLASNDNWTIKIWDLKASKELRSFQAPAFTRVVVFTRDGERVVTGHDDGRICVWDAKTAKRVKTLKGHTDWVVGLAISGDGTRLASASLDLSAKVWDLETGKTVQTFKGHDWYLSSVAFSPDNKKLVTGADDKTARLWDVESGNQLLTLRGHTDWVRRVTFSPNGKWIATAGDKTVRIWRAATGEEVTTISDHTDAVTDVVFSPDGRILATSGQDKKTMLWDVASLIPSQ